MILFKHTITIGIHRNLRKDLKRDHSTLPYLIRQSINQSIVKTMNSLKILFKLIYINQNNSKLKPMIRMISQ